MKKTYYDVFKPYEATALLQQQSEPENLNLFLAEVLLFLLLEARDKKNSLKSSLTRASKDALRPLRLCHKLKLILR